MHDAINILKQIRRLTHQAVSGLTQGQYFTIPAGFDNNIAWNIGHIIVVQQRLHYKLTGLEPYISAAQMAMFAPGTSPDDWEQLPDILPLLERLVTLPDKLETDYDAGQFVNFQPYTTSTGVFLGSMNEALVFNNYHEGLHFGYIQALKNLVVG
jgi:hypothetical protein